MCPSGLVCLATFIKKNKKKRKEKKCLTIHSDDERAHSVVARVVTESVGDCCGTDVEACTRSGCGHSVDRVTGIICSRRYCPADSGAGCARGCSLQDVIGAIADDWWDVVSSCAFLKSEKQNIEYIDFGVTHIH